MEKVTFTPLQKHIFDKVSRDPVLSKQFYFTGGTALSVFYLHHRESEEFDFLPKMLVPLKLSHLKAFFKQKAVELAKRVVE